MNSSRRLGWIVLVLLVFSAFSATAGFGTLRRHGCTGAAGSWSYRWAGETRRYLKIDVPANAAKLVVVTGIDGHRDYGNCSLYMRYGALPGRTSPNTRISRLPGYRQRLQVSNPPAGRYYIRLYGRSKYRTCIKVVVTPKPPPSVAGTWSGKGSALGGSQRFSVRMSQSDSHVSARMSIGSMALSAYGSLSGNRLSLKISPFTYSGIRVSGSISATVSEDSISGSIRITAGDRTIPGSFSLTRTGRSLAAGADGGGLLEAMLKALVP